MNVSLNDKEHERVKKVAEGAPEWFKKKVRSVKNLIESARSGKRVGRALVGHFPEQVNVFVVIVRAM